MVITFAARRDKGGVESRGENVQVIHFSAIGNVNPFSFYMQIRAYVIDLKICKTDD